MVVTQGQALATKTAKGQPLEQRWAFARRMAPLAAATVRHGVLQQASTIALILFPVDVTWMGLGQNRVPLILRHAANETFAIRRSAGARLTMHVTAGVARIFEQLQGQAVGQGAKAVAPCARHGAPGAGTGASACENTSRLPSPRRSARTPGRTWRALVEPAGLDQVRRGSAHHIRGRRATVSVVRHAAPYSRCRPASGRGEHGVLPPRWFPSDRAGADR